MILAILFVNLGLTYWARGLLTTSQGLRRIFFVRSVLWGSWLVAVAGQIGELVRAFDKVALIEPAGKTFALGEMIEQSRHWEVVAWTGSILVGVWLLSIQLWPLISKDNEPV